MFLGFFIWGFVHVSTGFNLGTIRTVKPLRLISVRKLIFVRLFVRPLYNIATFYDTIVFNFWVRFN